MIARAAFGASTECEIARWNPIVAPRVNVRPQ
jgi:hypothetical protein